MELTIDRTTRVIRQEYILTAAKNKRVLDIGCMAADKLMDLHKQLDSCSSTCVGLDLVAGPGVVVGNAEDFSLSQEFDVVVAGEIIEHLTRPGGLVESAARHLVPGGRLLITTPNPFSAVVLRRTIFGRPFPNDHQHVLLFDVDVLANFIKRFSHEFSRARIVFCDDDQPSTLPYRLTKLLGGIRRGFSSGILADLQRR